MTDELQARLEAARARKAAADAKLAAREAEAAAVAEVARAEIEADDAEAIEDATARVGEVGVEIAVVRTPMGCVIVKRCTGAMFRRFQDQAKFDSRHTEEFVRPCVLYPDASRLDAIFEKLPATLAQAANAICELAGHRAEANAGKS